MAKKTQNDLENSDPLPNSGVVEWPCKPTAESSGWPSSWPNDSSKSKLQTPLPTAEDEAANKAQLPALLAVSEYLKPTLTLDDDEDDFPEYITDDEDDFDSEDEEEEGFKDYDFFMKLFKGDNGLREYYERNRENGEFCCLVCCGVREKGWKRFKNCGALVQHAITIAKTKKRRAHRAYCQVVCDILGWDFNRLPSIVLSAGDKAQVTFYCSYWFQFDIDGFGLMVRSQRLMCMLGYVRHTLRVRTLLHTKAWYLSREG